MLRFNNNSDIRIYMASAIKELKVLKKYYKFKVNSMPIKIAKDVVVVFLYLAYWIKDILINKQLA